MTEVCEAKRNWRGTESSYLIGQRQETCLTGPLEYKIPRDICTHFGRYLYSTRCSWIINVHILHCTSSSQQVGEKNKKLEDPTGIRCEAVRSDIL